MAVDVARPGSGSVEPQRTGGSWPARLVAWVQGIPAGYRSILNEMRKVSWPDRESIQKMSISVIALSLFIGAVIALMDFTLQQVLVRWIPAIFSGR
jgi:preprotein translocase SecE subunit